MRDTRAGAGRSRYALKPFTGFPASSVATGATPQQLQRARMLRTQENRSYKTGHILQNIAYIKPPKYHVRGKGPVI